MRRACAPESPASRRSRVAGVARWRSALYQCQNCIPAFDGTGAKRNFLPPPPRPQRGACRLFSLFLKTHCAVPLSRACFSRNNALRTMPWRGGLLSRLIESERVSVPAFPQGHFLRALAGNSTSKLRYTASPCLFFQNDFSRVCHRRKKQRSASFEQETPRRCIKTVLYYIVKNAAISSVGTFWV